MARPEISSELREELDLVRNGAALTGDRARGSGPLSSVEVLRHVMAMIAEDTGNPAYSELAEDALKAEHARGVEGTARYVLGEATEDTAVVANMCVQSPFAVQPEIRVVHRSMAYQRIAETRLWVTDADGMRETVGGTD